MQIKWKKRNDLNHKLVSKFQYPYYFLAGITGVLLFLIMIIIFVFTYPTIRKKAYSFFWLTHSFYTVLYVLMLVHGLARITGPPRFWLFFIGPGIIFLLDKVRTTSITLTAFDSLRQFAYYNRITGSQPSNQIHGLGHFRNGITTLGCYQNKILPTTELQILIRPVGTISVYWFPSERIPFVHANFGTAWKFPVLPHQGARPVDLEVTQLLRP